MNVPVSQFYDNIAPLYDNAMEAGFISRFISRRFQEFLVEKFQSAGTVLDVGCGSGTDALFLGGQGVRVVGFDISPGMIQIAREKAAAAGLEEFVQFSTGDATRLNGLGDRRFDGAYSNFNVLNHLEDLGGFAKSLAEKLLPGAPVVLTMMNRVCVPEVLGYLARLRLATAVRKLWSRQDTLALRMHLYFPTETVRHLEPCFSVQRIEGFGLLLPPAQLYKGKYFRRFFNIMAALERPLLRLFPFYQFCDIYILILKKNES